MSKAILVEPTIEYKTAFFELLEEWTNAHERIIPWVLRVDNSDFDAMVTFFQNQSKGIGLKEGMVPSSTYWLVSHDRIIGAVNIRHYLTPQLQNIGGHIGYGVRPSERLKGYGTEMLRQALKKAKDIGIEKALITCDKDNIGSAKVIENNGGVLGSEDIVNGVPILRYWIDNGMIGMDALQIVPCTDNDLYTLAILNKQLIEDEGHDNPMNVEQLKERMESFIHSEYRAFLFKQSNDIVGYALVNMSREPLYLRQFFVCRHFRRKGFGTFSFKKLMQELGNATIDIEVLSQNKRGIEFWKSLGFCERSIYMRCEKDNLKK